jgi:DNA-directed RNA polymerase specialized sigma24 family protein
VAADSDTADPDNQYDLDVREWVIEMLNLLPKAQHDVLTLIFDGLSPAEIASALDKDPQTVRSNLAHARRRLIVDVSKNELPTRRQPVHTGHEQRKGE